VVGKGSFGKVIQVVKKDTGKIYAMKVLNKKTIIERNEAEHTKSEKAILQKLAHPFLVNLNYAFQTPDKLYFVMDFVNGGELFFHLQQEERFDEPRIKFYAAEISLGLEYLHSNKILYRDLKPENILIRSSGHICLTDFGISKQGFEGGENKTQTFVGTPEYLAPEILQGKPYGLAVDYWSLGTLFYEMCTGLPPFYAEDVQKMYQKILKAPIAKPDGISDDAWDLLQALLERDPEKRLTDPAKFKAHPFFKALDFEKLVTLKLDPPYKPPVKDDLSTAMIDSQFTDEKITESEFLSGETVKNFEGFTFGGAGNKDKKGVA
jgi:serine/threonine protein kinase